MTGQGHKIYYARFFISDYAALKLRGKKWSKKSEKTHQG
jgi:hypothetical protein